jgi:hypothetical protein
MYTSGELLAIIAGLVTIITAISVGVVNVIVALRTSAKIEQTVAETKSISAQVREVHVLTNSNLSAVKAELATAAMQIAALLDVVQDLKSERSKTSLSTALHTTVTVPGAPASSPVLEQIEQNTDKTAKNTSKTDAAVAGLVKDQP